MLPTMVMLTHSRVCFVRLLVVVVVVVRCAARIHSYHDVVFHHGNG